VCAPFLHYYTTKEKKTFCKTLENFGKVGVLVFLHIYKNLLIVYIYGAQWQATAQTLGAQGLAPTAWRIF
jgi:hypothetical protein